MSATKHKSSVTNASHGVAILLTLVANASLTGCAETALSRQHLGLLQPAGYVKTHVCDGPHCKSHGSAGAFCGCQGEPAFFGYSETCWRSWPEGWVGCPIVIEDTMSELHPKLPPLQAPRELELPATPDTSSWQPMQPSESIVIPSREPDALAPRNESLQPERELSVSDAGEDVSSDRETTANAMEVPGRASDEPLTRSDEGNGAITNADRELSVTEATRVGTPRQAGSEPVLPPAEAQDPAPAVSPENESDAGPPPVTEAEVIAPETQDVNQSPTVPQSHFDPAARMHVIATLDSEPQPQQRLSELKSLLLRRRSAMNPQISLKTVEPVTSQPSIPAPTRESLTTSTDQLQPIDQATKRLPSRPTIQYVRHFNPAQPQIAHDGSASKEQETSSLIRFVQPYTLK